MYFDAFTRFGAKPHLHSNQPWTLEHLLDEMRHCSISGGLVTSTACTLYDSMLENVRLCEQLKDYDHLFPIWNVAPHWTDEFPAPEELTRLMKEYDVRAVTLNPRTNGWQLASETSEPLLRELERTRTVSIIDLRTEADECDLERLLSKYPELPVLLVGVSWTRQRSVIPLLLKFKNLHIAFDHFQICNGIEWLVSHGCLNQLVYASNAVDMSMGAHRAYIDYADLSENDRKSISSGNLIRLLKGQKPPMETENKDEDELMKAVRRGDPIPALTIDCHAHILDEGLNGAGGSYTMFDGGPSGMLRLAKRMGVEAAGLTSWNGLWGGFAEEGNECVRAALDSLPEGYWGIAHFDVTHLTPEETRTKMNELFEDRRFLGLKPYIKYGVHYDDPAYHCWWEFGSERRLYALIHPNREDLSELDALCRGYPKMTFVAAHCGASYTVADAAIALAKKHSNFLAEITLTPVCMGIIDYLVDGAGADRVVYGSDQPMRDPRQQLGWVVFSRMPVEAKKKVLGLNAKKMLDRIRSAQGCTC